MAIDFPDSPSENDIYTVNGKRWIYSNGKWSIYGTTAPDATASDTEPSGVGDGHIWYRSDQSQTLIRYDNTWVEVGSAGGFDNASTNFPTSLDSATGFAAVEALQAKVGADSSAVTSSHDYKIADHASRITTLEGASSGGGTALITATNFSGASAVSVDNCFTSDYYVYTIQFHAVGGGSQLYFRLRSSGTDAATNYSRGQAVIRYSDGYFSNDGHGTSQTYIALSYPSAYAASRTITVYQPYESTYTNVWYQGNQESFVQWGGGTHVAASSFDGFTIYPLSSSLTGRLEVYGWVKS